MKRIIMTLAFSLLASGIAFAQEDPSVIQLNQSTGKFEKEGLTLKPGKYIFEVSNVGVDHEVGFVIAKVTDGKEGNHLKSSYLAKAIKDGETAKSQVVELKEGVYNYFCPLNPTPHYKIIVKD